MSYIKRYLDEAVTIIKGIDQNQIERMIAILLETRAKGGRLFFLGVGGSAGNCSHAVNDFRKIGGFEAYTPTDNVSELTARTNDEGWETTFAAWLKGSRLRQGDCVWVFSVFSADTSTTSASIHKARSRHSGNTQLPPAYPLAQSPQTFFPHLLRAHEP